MEWEITRLVGLFESGRITRRELVAGLTAAIESANREAQESPSDSTGAQLATPA